MWANPPTLGRMLRSRRENARFIRTAGVSASGAGGAGRRVGMLLAGVVLVAVLGEVAFLARDARLPTDPARAYDALPELYGSLRAGEPLDWDAMWRVPGSWLVALQATLLLELGRTARVFQIVALLAHAGLLVAV